MLAARSSLFPRAPRRYRRSAIAGGGRKSRCRCGGTHARVGRARSATSTARSWRGLCAKARMGRTCSTRAGPQMPGRVRNRSCVRHPSRPRTNPRGGRFPGPTLEGDRAGRTRQGCLCRALGGRHSKRGLRARMVYQGSPEPGRAWQRPKQCIPEPPGFSRWEVQGSPAEVDHPHLPGDGRPGRSPPPWRCTRPASRSTPRSAAEPAAGLRRLRPARRTPSRRHRSAPRGPGATAPSPRAPRRPSPGRPPVPAVRAAVRQPAAHPRRPG